MGFFTKANVLLVGENISRSRRLFKVGV